MKTEELKRLEASAPHTELEKKLNRSGLPKGSKDRLRKQFAKSLDGLDAAIAEEFQNHSMSNPAIAEEFRNAFGR